MFNASKSSEFQVISFKNDEQFPDAKYSTINMLRVIKIGSTTELQDSYSTELRDSYSFVTSIFFPTKLEN